MQKIITHNTNETTRFAIELGETLQKGHVIALSGDLGTGKTIITKGIAKSLHIEPDDVTSPTFNLLDIHTGTLPLYHFDLYRIEDSNELDNLFFEEYWEGDGISIIEWAERAENRLPANTIKISIEYIDESKRGITIENFNY